MNVLEQLGYTEVLISISTESETFKNIQAFFRLYEHPSNNHEIGDILIPKGTLGDQDLPAAMIQSVETGEKQYEVVNRGIMYPPNAPGTW